VLIKLLYCKGYLTSHKELSFDRVIFGILTKIQSGLHQCDESMTRPEKDILSWKTKSRQTQEQGVRVVQWESSVMERVTPDLSKIFDFSSAMETNIR
jgi:hypothetical protein